MINRHEDDPRTFQTIGAAMEVHRELGNGLLEAPYHEALKLEFEARNIPYTHETALAIYYKGRKLESTYRADFIVFESVIVEVKVIKQLTANEEAQIINYLKISGLEVGLLLNFGTPSLQFKRFALSKNHP